MRLSRFQEAALLVDSEIRRSGEVISAMERNKRVLGAMQQIREGSEPDGKATLSTLRFNVGEQPQTTDVPPEVASPSKEGSATQQMSDESRGYPEGAK